MSDLSYFLFFILIGVIGGTNLRDLAKRIYVGTCLGSAYMNDTHIDKMTGEQFNMVTAEWEMKWAPCEPQRGNYTYELADSIVAYAKQHDMKIRGHTLIWHREIPKWVDDLEKDSLREAVKNRIKNAMTHFKGQIYAWDVINEVIDNTGELRNSTFSINFGESFIPDAFTLARKTDPSAKLYINDYGIESINTKSTALYNLVKKLRTRGVPIDGVGFQCHFKTGGIPSTFEKNLKRFVDLGVEVAITELDLSIEIPANEKKLQQQAHDYAKLYQVCESISKCVGVSVWGFTDKYSWIKSREPCLWDKDFNPKPAVAAVEAVLK